MTSELTAVDPTPKTYAEVLKTNFTYVDRTTRNIKKEKLTEFNILKGQLLSYLSGEYGVELRHNSVIEFKTVDGVVLPAQLDEILWRDGKITYVFKEQTNE